MRAEEFDRLVIEALEAVPERFRQRMRNIAIVVEDAPTRSQLQACEVPDGETMYGYYDGVALTERDTDGEPMLPDRIIIFRQPLFEDFGNDVHMLREEIVRTVGHEIAHHFGIDDDRLEEIDRY